jgi:protein SCO1/2
MTNAMPRLLTWALLAAATFAAICITLALVLSPRRPAAAEAFSSIRHPAGVLPKLWPSPHFSLVDQHGAPVTDGSLRGQPYIADFIFTQCTSACPMMTAKMVQLQRRLRAAEVRFVSFSVDPAHDTPAALATYATRWNPSESRWSLLATTPDSLARVMEGFRVTAEATSDPGSPILHSTLFFLVDADGNVRSVYDSDDTRALDALVGDAASLAASRTASTGAPALYGSLGCAGCHDNPQIAPPLVNLRGTRRLEGGGTVTIDDDYLRSSILDPARDRVAGYTVRMPSYRGILTDAQVGALVTELRARTSDAGSEHDDVRVVVDPVCHMKVRTAPGAFHATVDGAEYYFCSATCRDAFLKDAKRYVPDAAP